MTPPCTPPCETISCHRCFAWDARARTYRRIVAVLPQHTQRVVQREGKAVTVEELTHFAVVTEAGR